jgi:hypothetical protein
MMGELHDFLGRGTRGFDPSPEEGLERTLARGRRRQRRRHGVAFLTAIGLFGATVAGAVILRGHQSVPLAGPTPTPSALYGRVVTDEGTWMCTPAFRNQGRQCLARIGEAVDVASGIHEGHAWTVRAFTVLYDGPDYSRGPDEMAGTRVRRAMVCTRWQVEGNPPSSLCQRTTGPDALFGLEVPPKMSASLIRLPIARPLEPFDAGPLDGVEDSGGGFLGQDAGPWTAILAWTPQGTARLEVSADGVDLAPAALVGPFQELRTTVMWFVVFIPKETREVTYTAYDAGGSLLWRETDRYRSDPSAEGPPEPPALRRLPEDRTVVAAGIGGGTGWEVFTFETREGPIYGYALDSGEWSYTEDPEPHPDPCAVRSNSIHWIYLRQDPERVVVLQFAPISPDVARVTFLLNDGSSVEGDVAPVADEAIPWNMFTAVFEGAPEVHVADVVLEGSDGARLNDPASC